MGHLIMGELKVNRNGLLCGSVIFLQLLWMQTKVFYPGLSGPVYQLLYYMKYIGTFAIFTVTISTPRRNGVTARQKEYIRLFVPLFILYFAVEVLSFLSSPVTQAYGLSFVTRSIAYILDKVCVVVMVSCVWLLRREKSIECICKALLFDGVLIILFAIPRIGIAGILYTLGEVFGVAESPSSLLEVHELTYCLGLCIIYYLFFARKQLRLSKFVLLVFLFIIGGKRIAFAGIVVSGIFALVVRKKGLKKGTLIVVGTLGIAVSLGYIAILYNGEFLATMATYGINVMGRDAIYSYFLARTKFSPSYLGWGLAGVSKMIENMSRAEVGNMVVVRGLHNDILKIYIDFGFFGSILWFAYQLLYMPIQLFEKLGKRDATLYVALIIFAFVTYLTDNTENYFVFQVLLFLIPLTAGARDIEGEEI